jgi:hypothetical protein
LAAATTQLQMEDPSEEGKIWWRRVDPVEDLAE